MQDGRGRRKDGGIGRKLLILVLVLADVRVCGAHATPAFLHRHKLSKGLLRNEIVNALGRR